MTADVEDQYIVAQATEPLDENGCLVRSRITCRHRDEIIEVDRDQVDYMDISPRMMVSIATAMIPFLPNDDANRALMGANMQRQAVPLLKPQAPSWAPVWSTRSASTPRWPCWLRATAWSPRWTPGMSPSSMTAA